MYYLVTDENNRCLYVAKTPVISTNNQIIYEVKDSTYVSFRELSDSNDLINWNYNGEEFKQIDSIDPNGTICQKKIKLGGIFESKEFAFDPELYKTNQVQSIPIVTQRETWQGSKGKIETTSVGILPVENHEATWSVAGTPSNLLNKTKNDSSYIECVLPSQETTQSKLRFRLQKSTEDFDLDGVIIHADIPEGAADKIGVQVIKRTSAGAFSAHLLSPNSFYLSNGINYLEFAQQDTVNSDYYLELLFFTNIDKTINGTENIYIRKINFLTEITY